MKLPRATQNYHVTAYPHTSHRTMWFWDRYPTSRPMVNFVILTFALGILAANLRDISYVTAQRLYLLYPGSRKKHGAGFGIYVILLGFPAVQHLYQTTFKAHGAIDAVIAASKHFDLHSQCCSSRVNSLRSHALPLPPPPSYSSSLERVYTYEVESL